MAIVDWPEALVPVAPRIPVLEKNIASAGTSLTGQERMIVTDAGRWRYGFRLQLRNTRDALTWRALLAQAEGRANRVRVPIYDMMGDPAAVAGFRRLMSDWTAAIPHDDGTFFDDGSGYDWSISNGTAAALAIAGATSISITMPTGLAINPGQRFSDGDWLYEVMTATLTTGTTYALTFRPRLRAALDAGDGVSFDRLYCIMRIASDDDMNVEQDQYGFADLSVNFTEALV